MGRRVVFFAPGCSFVWALSGLFCSMFSLWGGYHGQESSGEYLRYRRFSCTGGSKRRVKPRGGGDEWTTDSEMGRDSQSGSVAAGNLSPPSKTPDFTSTPPMLWTRIPQKGRHLARRPPYVARTPPSNDVTYLHACASATGWEYRRCR